MQVHISEPTANARVGNSLYGFSSESLVFCEPKCDSLMKKSASIPLLFLKSSGSELLMVALL